MFLSCILLNYFVTLWINVYFMNECLSIDILLLPMNVCNLTACSNRWMISMRIWFKGEPLFFLCSQCVSRNGSITLFDFDKKGEKKWIDFHICFVIIKKGEIDILLLKIKKFLIMTYGSMLWFFKSIWMSVKQSNENKSWKVECLNSK